MADREIRLVGTFQDGITDKLRKLNREISGTIRQFEKLQSKLRPIARDMGIMAMAAERFGSAMSSQRNSFEANIRAMRQYRSEVGRMARAQRSIRATALPSAPAPRAGRGGMDMGGRGGGGRGGRISPRVQRGGGGAGIGEIAIGSAIGGVMTSAITSGFQQGVSMMMKPFQAFGSAFAERMGDEMADIQSAGGMFALDKKSKTPLFQDFEGAMAMQERLNRSLAKSAAALPGATNDYVRAARGLTDTVMMAFGKNEDAFKKFATELGAREGATSEEAITKVLSRFTEQTVLLGQGQQGGMPLTMLMEQLIQKDKVNIGGMKMRYAQLRSNPLLASMLEDAEAEINKTGVGTADRFRAVMKALDAALPQEVINKMRRSVSGLQEALRSSFFDPDTGLFGLSRELNVAIPKVDQYGRYIKENGEVAASAAEAAQETTSLFKLLRDVLANFAVPILELVGVLPQIFDPFEKIASQFVRLREVSNRFYQNFNGFTRWNEEQAEALMKQAAAVTDPATQSKLTRQANLLKEQAGARGALATLNKALLDFGAVDPNQYAANVKILSDLSSPAIEAMGKGGIAKMAKSLLTQFANSDLVADIVETIGAAFAATIDTIFTAVDNIFKGIEGKTGNKLVDAFARGFSSVITPKRAEEIMAVLDRVLTKVFNMAGDILINKVIPAIGFGILKGLEAAWNAGPLGKFLVVVTALALFQKALIAATAAAETMAMLKGVGAALPMGPGRIKGRPQVFARRGAEKLRGAATALKTGPAGSVAGLLNKGGLLSFFGGAGSKNFVAGLKAISPKLLAFGGVLSAIIALFEGKGIVGALAEGLGAAGGTAIGAAIGTVIFPGIGTAIGAALGGWIGTMDGVTIPLRDAFQAVTDTLWPIVTGVADAFGSLLHTAFSLVSVFNPFASRIGVATDGFDGLHATIIAFKVVLWPIVGAFQLFEQIINTLVLAFRGLELAVLMARLGLSKLNPFADPAARARLEQEVAAAAGRAVEAQGRFGESFKRHQGYYQTPKPSAAPTRNQRGGRSGASAPAPMAMAGTTPPPAANPVPALQALNTKQSGANALLTQVKAQVAASSNNQQARIREVTASVNRLNARVAAGMPVKVVNSPTVKFDMGGMGPVGGGIGGFTKTSGYGMRWGKMHQGNDYGMPVGTKLGIGGPGKVLGAGYWGGYGNAMDIGGPGGMVYRFAHLSKFLAPVGANLPPGMPFALSGNTGRSTGPHLHFEARPGGLGPVNPDAYAGIIRANFAGTALGPLMGAMGSEMKNMPYGAQLAVANSDEIFMKPKQMAHVIESSARAGAEGTGNITTGPITISVDGYNRDPRELTEIIASELVTAMYRQSRSEVLTA